MNEAKRILAIDTSGRTGSVVVASWGEILSETILPPTSRHAIELVPTIDALLRGQGWGPKYVEEIYVSLGPGSFSGLRIATAFVRAFVQANGGVTRIVGVPTLDAMAENAPVDFDTVVPVLDAKRGQVFTARYERGGDGRLARATEQQLANPRQFLEAALERSPAKRVAILGEGVDYHRDAIPPGEAFVELPKEVWPSQARHVLKLGLEKAIRGEYTPLEMLLPIYIRLPEAEEVYRRKHGLAI